MHIDRFKSLGLENSESCELTVIQLLGACRQGMFLHTAAGTVVELPTLSSCSAGKSSVMNLFIWTSRNCL